MKYAIISDVHANEQALRLVLADARAQGADQVICLGDVVGYGPSPAKALTLVRQSAAITLAGNHDDAVCGRLGIETFIGLASDAVQRHRQALGGNDLNWLRSLPYDCRFEDAIAAHGDFTDPRAFHYVEDERDAAVNFAATTAQLMFVGHTHEPGFFLTGQSGKVYHLEPQDFTLEDGKRYIVNPGSVGYPRAANGTCHSTYVLYDAATRTVFFRTLPFAVSSVMQRGLMPRHKAVLSIVAALLAAATIIGTLIVWNGRSPAVNTIRVETPVRQDPVLLLAEKSLTLGLDVNFVRANLILDRKSDPVTLTVTFKSDSGKILGESMTTVKESARQRFKVPTGSVSAHFKVRKQTSEALIRILSFKPTTK